MDGDACTTDTDRVIWVDAGQSGTLERIGLVGKRRSPNGRDLFPFRCSMSYDVAVDWPGGLCLSAAIRCADSPWSPPRSGGTAVTVSLGGRKEKGCHRVRTSRAAARREGGGGKRNGGGNMSSGTTGGAKKNAYCSFCRKSYRDVGPLVEGPGDVYICGDCIELCQSDSRPGAEAARRSQDAFYRYPHSSRNQGTARRLRDRPGTGQEGPLGGRAQPLQATGPWRRSRDRSRARQVEYPADRPDRLRQDLAGADPGPRA